MGGQAGRAGQPAAQTSAARRSQLGGPLRAPSIQALAGVVWCEAATALALQAGSFVSRGGRRPVAAPRSGRATPGRRSWLAPALREWRRAPHEVARANERGFQNALSTADYLVLLPCSSAGRPPRKADASVRDCGGPHAFDAACLAPWLVLTARVCVWTVSCCHYFVSPAKGGHASRGEVVGVRGVASRDRRAGDCA
jgi:hypothetical protein